MFPSFMKIPVCKYLNYILFLFILILPTSIHAEETAAVTSELAPAVDQVPSTFKEKKDKEGYVLNLKEFTKILFLPLR